MKEKMKRIGKDTEISLLELGVPEWLIEPLVIYHGIDAERCAYEHLEVHLLDIDSCYLCQIGFTGE